MTRAWTFLVWVLLSGSNVAAATPKTYTGTEAAALRCANTMAMTGTALHDVGKMGTPERDVMMGITILILERHVSGTWAQKTAALEQVRDRRSVDETLEDFTVFAERCLEQFPIN